jgi:hypothetical protein
VKQKQILIILLFCIWGLKAHSQEDRIDSLLNILLFEDEDVLDLVSSSDKFQFLYTRVSYDTKTFFAGRDIGLNQYNMSGQLSWFHSCGISLGAAAVYYSAMDPKINTVLLMAGYSGHFTKSPDYLFRLSYDRFFFPTSDTLISSKFNSSASAGITIDKKIAGTRLDYSLLMGKEYNSQLSWDIYGRFVLYKIGKYDRIKFEPEVSFYAGNDQTIISQLGVIPGSKPPKFAVTESEQTKFGWMNTELKLPVSIGYKNFDFEFGYNLNFPRSIVTTEKLESTSFFNFSIGYLISL